MEQTPLLLLALLTFIVWSIIYSLTLRVTIFEFERGLLYIKGRHKKVLEPGEHWLFKKTSTVTRIDIRPKVLTVPGQEILSADSISLKVSLATQIEIVDPYLAVNKVSNYLEAVYLIVQVAAREVIGSHKIDELLEQRATLSQTLLELSAPKALEIGIKIISINIKDIMFPGDLKNVFAQVVKAQKEGLASLERARGESAALRNLANAAKLLDNNPSLMQLRILQAVGESTGNTVMLGLPAGAMPVAPGKRNSPAAKPGTTES